MAEHPTSGVSPTPSRSQVLIMPRVVLTFDPAGPQYAISESAEMPRIKAIAQLEHVVSRLGVEPQFTWTASITYHGHDCPHSLGRRTVHPPLRAKTLTPHWSIPFTQTRGGRLSTLR